MDPYHAKWRGDLITPGRHRNSGLWYLPLLRGLAAWLNRDVLSDSGVFM